MAKRSNRSCAFPVAKCYGQKRACGRHFLPVYFGTVRVIDKNKSQNEAETLLNAMFQHLRQEAAPPPPSACRAAAAIAAEFFSAATGYTNPELAAKRRRKCVPLMDEKLFDNAAEYCEKRLVAFREAFYLATCYCINTEESSCGIQQYPVPGLSCIFHNFLLSLFLSHPSYVTCSPAFSHASVPLSR